MNINTGIQSKCKVCEKMAPAQAFVLSHEHKVMVCPDCAKGRPVKKMEQEQVSSKPPGWDNEDELLEKLHRQKEARKEQLQKSDFMTTRKCPVCEFVLKPEALKEKIITCPYCNTKMKIKY